ncbi:MAG: type II secretory pathway pseudopilin PulG [Phycisphaerales bacterium]|jgi:type II secretory pathway pseudopilin PulG
MLARNKKPGPVARAFTLFEVLIVLALLIGVSAVVLPAVLDRGLGDLRDDTRLRLDAALLDAQREARRTGQTVQVSLRTDNAAKNSEVLIWPMPATTPTAEGDAGIFDAGAFDADAEEWWGTDTEPGSDAENGGQPAAWDEPEGATTTILAYAMPDGTVIPAADGLVLQMPGGSFTLNIDAGSATVRLTASPTDEDGQPRSPAGTEDSPANELSGPDELDGWEP